jgi:hypothetical protein
MCKTEHLCSEIATFEKLQNVVCLKLTSKDTNALGYSLQRWKELVTYATDGHLNIDNNPVENSIRCVALG